jgi:hypothetical protein
VLSLLLLGTLTISGYQEVDRRGLLAARETMFMGNWLAGRDDPAARLRWLHDRHLADPGVQRPGGQGQLVALSGLSASASMREPTGIAGAATSLLLAPLRVTSGFLGSGFDINGRSLHAGSIQLHLPPDGRLPSPFRDLDLRLNAPHAMLGDAWNAGEVRHVEQRTAGLVPGSRLAGISAAWRPLLAPLALLEPSLSQLCLGMLEGDRVPENRLSQGSTPLPGRRCP